LYLDDEILQTLAETGYARGSQIRNLQLSQPHSKCLLYRSQVRKSTVRIFHQSPSKYTEGSFTRGTPPRK
jgi:hypothetical protein